MMAIGISLVVALGALTVLAVVLYTAFRSDRSAQFEEHMDENMSDITEYRIRRNFNQGG
jgi:hypothetical protein